MPEIKVTVSQKFLDVFRSSIQMHVCTRSLAVCDLIYLIIGMILTVKNFLKTVHLNNNHKII